MALTGPVLVKTDNYLTNYSLQLPQGNFVVDDAFGVVTVEKRTDKIRLLGDSQFQIEDSLRRGRAATNEINREEGTEKYYTAEERAFKYLLLDEDVDENENVVNDTEEVTDLLDKKLALSIEFDVASKLTSTTNITNYKDLSAAGNYRWSDYSNSHPYEDINTAMQNRWASLGLKMNTIILPYDVALFLSHHPDTQREYRNYPGAEKLIKDDIILPTTIKGARVVIAESTYNNADLNKTASRAEVWGNNVLLAYVGPAAKRSYTLFKLFRKQDKKIERWRNTDPAGEWIKISKIQDEKLIDGAAGYLFTNVLAS